FEIYYIMRSHTLHKQKYAEKNKQYLVIFVVVY
ncbi:MAG: hypothetical protein ACJA0H_001414, partial [Francisellaceae bacterium]